MRKVNIWLDFEVVDEDKDPLSVELFEPIKVVSEVHLDEVLAYLWQLCQVTGTGRVYFEDTNMDFLMKQLRNAQED